MQKKMSKNIGFPLKNCLHHAKMLIFKIFKFFCIMKRNENFMQLRKQALLTWNTWDPPTRKIRTDRKIRIRIRWTVRPGRPPRGGGGCLLAHSKLKSDPMPQAALPACPGTPGHSTPLPTLLGGSTVVSHLPPLSENRKRWGRMRGVAFRQVDCKMLACLLTGFVPKGKNIPYFGGPLLHLDNQSKNQEYLTKSGFRRF